MIGSYVLSILGYYFFVIKVSNIDYIQNSLLLIFFISTISQQEIWLFHILKENQKLRILVKLYQVMAPVIE